MEPNTDPEVRAVKLAALEVERLSVYLSPQHARLADACGRAARTIQVELCDLFREAEATERADADAVNVKEWKP